MSAKPLKILLATPLYPPDIGGPATYAKLLVDELPQRGFRVKVESYSWTGGYPKLLRYGIFSWRILKASLWSDVVYSQDTVFGLASLVAAKLTGNYFMVRVPGDYAWEQSSQRFGVKDSIDDFQHKKYGWRTEFLRSVQKFVVSHADLVITPSQYFRKLVGGWTKHPHRVVTIYNGLELKPVTQSHHFDRKTILSAGRLVPWKGFSELIETMKDLPTWHLVIAGDGPERANLETKIADLNLADRVTLTGTIAQNQLFSMLAGARVFVLNTSFESFSYQVVEAMHAGVPVITTHVGNLAEIIETDKEGILVAPNDQRALVAAITRFDQDETFRQNCIVAAKQKAASFSIDRTLEALVTEINKLKVIC